MLDIKAYTISNFSAVQMAKQVRFATAVALTNTAKEGQADVLQALDSSQGGAFTLRGKWFNPSNKYGIRVKTARKDDLQSAVMTNADWLIPHETGEDKKPRGNSLAIPTINVRRNKKDIIIRSSRPRNLKRAFVLTMKKSGQKVLFTRKGRKKKSLLVALYNLTAKANIRKQSTVVEPIKKIVEKRLFKNYEIALRRALATAK